MTKFSSILIANRGEIACRVIRTAKAQGYRTVAVYSDADAGAPHVKMADEAIFIGPSPVNESYLVQEKIIEAARISGAQAVHPGYGFLSENADFAVACEAAGLIFIGPSPDAIHLMGNKAEAKRRMLDAKVPCVPGYEGADQSDRVLIAEGEKINAPLMVKAAAGGGGRGMRLVNDVAELVNAIKLARAEAESAFGNGELILEKAIVRPRHVEVQVFADTQGNTIHLGERDCSVQRRHQKVIEEAPCPVMTDTLRAEMGAAAVAAAKSIHYRGAGTVEFLLDEKGNFYFLEMNTRLQVEHPVTELITGLDLVALQLQVAQGEPLGLNQKDITLTGHAIEARLYTEDPAQNFLPSSGSIDLWSPASGVGVRIDSGICTGQEISPFYDPMVAKVIAHGPTRDIARLRLIEALNATVLFGATHNSDFLVACLEKRCFAEGQATTAFIAEEFAEGETSSPEPDFTDSAVAAALQLSLEYEELYDRAVIVAPQLRNWASASPLISRKKYTHSEVTTHDLSVTPLSDKLYKVFNADNEVSVELISTEGTTAHISIDGMQHTVRYMKPRVGKIYLSINSRTNVYEDQIRLDGQQDEVDGSGKVVAPMHGLLLEIRVSAGDKVASGQTLAVLEAMKMHYEIVADASGTVTEVLVEPNNQVAADDLLIDIDTEA
ncbi:acetyl-CoA carboxylase biotin carboxylase subunit [Halieaceae bacterium IMCC8485]|jgi:geranyl-CoA carboxylase alpha subunit|uniref:Acetyl-CoA carboxylase biotin carboxylase subunit n=1 Tax=Candidatus Seongchinamella marina TaxID=2518990 RepID=A0ABT3SSG6_9GAMM|nr:acetyl-CoA carboxylase biotin carboxylase subunit [Candidatus Seongchinamella marina]MCX2972814.1 acetyl-CoA carboxylase biotin carboxylase subunit [Candidatus Seongchinamella marina]